jgi:hypothetical protein
MGSGAMIYIPNFTNIGSGIRKLMGGDSKTDRMEIAYAYFHFFFQNKESKLRKWTEREEK